MKLHNHFHSSKVLLRIHVFESALFIWMLSLDRMTAQELFLLNSKVFKHGSSVQHGSKKWEKGGSHKIKTIASGFENIIIKRLNSQHIKFFSKVLTSLFRNGNKFWNKKSFSPTWNYWIYWQKACIPAKFSLHSKSLKHISFVSYDCNSLPWIHR